MRFAEFSEFSYGYALTDNLINGGLLYKVRGAPVFPSLKDEGQAGGGYDVQIPVRGAPLFLQFKNPQVVTRASVNIPPGFTTPYYRMHLRPAKYSTQHQSLLEHERRGRLVFYAAPIFHATDALNVGFDNKEIPRRSVFVRPSQIGPLGDKPHAVAYCPGQSVAWIYSEPRQIERSVGSGEFFSEVQKSVRLAQPRVDDEQYFKGIAEEIIFSLTKAALYAEETAAQKPTRLQDDFSPTWQAVPYGESPQIRAERVETAARQRYVVALDRFGPVKAAGYLARFLLDCELIIMWGTT